MGILIKIIIFILSLNIFPYLSAQKKYIILSPSGKDTDKMSIIDSCYIRAWYAFNADTINVPNSYEDLQRLEIGKNFIKYYSYFTFSSDSLCTIWKKKHPQAKARPRRLGSGGKYPDHWSEYKHSEIFIDCTLKQLTEYARMQFYMQKQNSQATESVPVQEWTIHDDTMLLIGQRCQKATCYFRGRKYEAWFTMDIPISKGPWKFGGLPGLILKITDDKYLYSFECIRIEQFTSPIYIKRYEDYKYYRIMKREKLLKYQKFIHEYYGKATYYPLELE